MTTVALVGPDGSGKTSVADRLRAELGRPTAYVYMGINPDASNYQLPTTRLVWALRRRRGRRPDAGPPPAPAVPTAPTVPGETASTRSPGSTVKRVKREVKSVVRVLNLIAEELYRSFVVRRLEGQGKVVVFDRHYFLDYHAHDIAGRSRDLGRRLHGFCLRRLVPKPDIVVYLEAPAATLHARKGEGTVDDLVRRQADYERAFADLPRVERVDASAPLDEVVAAVRTVVLAALDAPPAS